MTLFAKIGSPIALGTALFFYFGWVRADAQARALGYDVTMLGLTTSDYVLRSVSVLFLPIVVLLLSALGLYSIHPIILQTLNRAPDNRATKVLVTLTRFAWIWCALTGLLIFLAVPSLRIVITPVFLTIGILMTMYGAHLRRHLDPRRGVDGVVMVIMTLLLAVAVFWDVERFAGLMGRGVAEYISSNPSTFAHITVLSAKDLELHQPGVTVTAVGSEESAYRHRYEGLRLLLHSDGKHFLLAYPPSGGPPAVIILQDTDLLRVEFSR